MGKAAPPSIISHGSILNSTERKTNEAYSYKNVDKSLQDNLDDDVETKRMEKRLNVGEIDVDSNNSSNQEKILNSHCSSNSDNVRTLANVSITKNSVIPQQCVGRSTYNYTSFKDNMSNSFKSCRLLVDVTPRPNPEYFIQPQNFSMKKDREETPRSLPPKAPAKPTLPISRIFPNRGLSSSLPLSSPENKQVSKVYVGCQHLYFNEHFSIVSRLGIGSFGEVFLVQSKDDGDFYAVKRCREKFKSFTDRKRRLEEVLKHEQLPKHPNCVELIRAWEERQQLYIQTELCKTSLSKLAEQNHHIPERLIWNYLVDLLMAVDHMHQHNLVHMDIKPDNIFISEANTCKLGDFGLVIDLSKKTSEPLEAMEGDPKYMAPELMHSDFGTPADVFSLGMTMLELACDLDLPKGGRLWHQLRSGSLPHDLLPSMSSELRSVISCMLEPNPQKRASAQEVLLHEFISKTWKRRKREAVFRRLKPVHLLKSSTPLKQGWEGQPPSPNLDNSLSDLDGEDSSSIHNSSLGHPLNASSGEDSFTSSFPVRSRRVKSAPPLRFRPHNKFSPVASFHRSCLSPTSLNGSVSEHTTPPKICVEEEELCKVEPKNLLQAFETIADENDE